LGDEFEDEAPKEAPAPAEAAPAKDEALPDVMGADTAAAEGDVLGDEFEDEPPKEAPVLLDDAATREEAPAPAAEMPAKEETPPTLPDVIGGMLGDNAGVLLSDDFGIPEANAKEDDQPPELRDTVDGATEQDDGELGATGPETAADEEQEAANEGPPGSGEEDEGNEPRAPNRTPDDEMLPDGLPGEEEDAAARPNEESGALPDGRGGEEEADGEAAAALPDDGDEDTAAPPDDGDDAIVAPLDDGDEHTVAPPEDGDDATVAPSEDGDEGTVAPPDDGDEAAPANPTIGALGVDEAAAPNNEDASATLPDPLGGALRGDVDPAPLPDSADTQNHPDALIGENPLDDGQVPPDDDIFGGTNEQDADAAQNEDPPTLPDLVGDMLGVPEDQPPDDAGPDPPVKRPPADDDDFGEMEGAGDMVFEDEDDF
jgi:hypothetical protein